MYICIYVYMYICYVYMYICINVYFYKSIHVYMYLCIYVKMYIRIYICYTPPPILPFCLENEDAAMEDGVQMLPARKLH